MSSLRFSLGNATIAQTVLLAISCTISQSEPTPTNGATELSDSVVVTTPDATPSKPDATAAVDATAIATSLVPQQTPTTRTGHVLLIDVYDCGVPDPAIDFGRWLNPAGISVANEIHAGLTRLANDEGNPVAEEELAESFTVSDDATRYEFTLRPNQSFSNGEPLLASHVKWSWERALRKSTPPSRARVVLGGIVGAGDILNGTNHELAGIEIIDDRSLIVNLEAPQSDWPAVISDPVAAVLHPTNAIIWDDVWVNDLNSPANTLLETDILPRQLPVGAGPFKLTKFVSSRDATPASLYVDRCILERNPHYWHPDKPALDGIIASIYPQIWDDQPATTDRQSLALSDSSLDIARSDLTGRPIRPQRNGQPFRHLAGTGHTSIRFFVLNPSAPPFNDINVRQAFARSLPDAVLEGEARATRIIPTEIAGTNGAPTERGTKPVTVAAPSSVGTEINLYIYAPELNANVHDPIIASWENELGVQVNVKRFRPVDDTVDPPLHELQIRDVSVYNAAPFAYDILKSALGAFGTDTMPPEFAELMTQLDHARRNLDTVQRHAKYLEIEQTLLDQAYILPIYADKYDFTLWLQPWVHGLQYPLPGGSYYRDVWFDDSAPTRSHRTGLH